jgi:glutamate--cysteine ligase
MSMVLPPKEGEKDDPGPPIEGRDQLLAYFASGEKPRSEFKIGTEHEKFGFLRESRAPLPYEGERGIEAILRRISEDPEDTAAHGAWTRVEEDGRIIGLTRSGASVSLEPGGQLELSGAPLVTLHETCEETGNHLELLKRACEGLEVGFIGIGFHPAAAYADFPSVPKARYSIMREYMPTRGSLGLDMMKRTCTVQANFDFESERDMVATMQTALAVSPLIVALFANSPFRDGKLTGRVSERAFVWTDTDPDRSGYPASFLTDDFGYETYLEYVLDVPMYFVRRDGKYLNYAGASFRTFMSEGLDGHVATMRDFEDHLTAVFPEVRLKRYLEVRSADCGPWSRICALPALWKGILYDQDARTKAWELMDGPSSEELQQLHTACAIDGYRATYRGRSVQEICQELLHISRGGLDRLSRRGRHKDETGFLDALVDEAERGESFADMLVSRFNGSWGGSLDPLWEDLEFFSA